MAKNNDFENIKLTYTKDGRLIVDDKKEESSDETISAVERFIIEASVISAIKILKLVTKQKIQALLLESGITADVELLVNVREIDVAKFKEKYKDGR